MPRAEAVARAAARAYAGPRAPLPADRFRIAVRLPLLAIAVAAPLAMGAVHEPVFVPLLAASWIVGTLSWARAHWVRAQGIDEPRVPAARLLAALHGLVLLQLVPLPPAVLRVVSPGSFAFHDRASLVPLTGWLPVSVNPADTARGLAFLAGLTLLYAAAFREMQDGRWRRRLAAAVVATGFTLTLVALVQSASPHPTHIYGVWRPRWDWGVFGPYVSRNHFAGYLAMAIPLGFAFAAESLGHLRSAWSGRRRGWLALGGAAGNAMIRRASAAMVLVVGLLASHSRGGLFAFGVSLVVSAVALRRHVRGILAASAMVVVAGVLWVDLTATWQAFAQRGIRGSRLRLWSEAAGMIPDFPVLGSGFNTFGTSFVHYARDRYHWYGEAHNEYLQAFTDLGVAGGLLVLALVARLFARAWKAASHTALDAGILGALAACAAHNVVDFNWQIPANAATFAMLAGLAVRRSQREPPAMDAPLEPPAEA